MNYIWGGIVLVSLIYSFFTGRLEETVNAAFEGAQSGITTVLSFAGIMCLWSGFMESAVRSGLCEMFKKILRPIIKLIFPNLKKNSEAEKYIILNVTSNILGTGNGATPMGVNAMRELSKLSKSQKPTEEMCLFTVMNTAAFQVLPSSIIALRTSFKSANPTDIIVPVWICSFIALCVAIISTKLMFKFIRRE